MLNKELLLVESKDLIKFKIKNYPSTSKEHVFVVDRGITWFEFDKKGYNIIFTDYDYGYKYSRKLMIFESGVVAFGVQEQDGKWITQGSLNNTPGTSNYGPDSVQATDIIIPDHIYGYGICYAAGTLITLHDGTIKKIEDITYDDELLVWDFDNGCFATAKPSWISKAQLYPYYYKITLEDGTQLDLIGSDGDCHRLFNVDKSTFVYGSRFNLGERTFKEDKSTPKVVSIERIDKEVVYYNMNTKYHINCFINGVLSSCRYNNLYPIKDMKFVKTPRAKVPLSVYSNVPVEYYYDLRLGEVDVAEFPIEETNDYVQKRIMLKA
jgi:hypothetical protein